MAATLTTRLCYSTSLDVTGQYEIEWRITNFDVLRSCYLCFSFDPSKTQIEHAASEALRWKIKLLLPNEAEGEENYGTPIKSSEIGYMISVKSTSKEEFFSLACRVNTSIFSLDQGDEKLMCKDKFCEKSSNYSTTKEYHFAMRKVPLDESRDVQDLLIRVCITLYSEEIKEKGYEASGGMLENQKEIVPDI